LSFEEEEVMAKSPEEPVDPMLLVAEQLDRIARQVDVALKLFLKERQGDRTLKDMVEELGVLGCKANDIANWLNAPLTSVAPQLSRLKANNAPARKPTKRAKP
jgi:hypothetical protein